MGKVRQTADPLTGSRRNIGEGEYRARAAQSQFIASQRSRGPAPAGAADISQFRSLRERVNSASAQGGASPPPAAKTGGWRRFAERATNSPPAPPVAMTQPTGAGRGAPSAKAGGADRRQQALAQLDSRKQGRMAQEILEMQQRGVIPFVHGIDEPDVFEQDAISKHGGIRDLEEFGRLQSQLAEEPGRLGDSYRRLDNATLEVDQMYNSGSLTDEQAQEAYEELDNRKWSLIERFAARGGGKPSHASGQEIGVPFQHESGMLMQLNSKGEMEILHNPLETEAKRKEQINKMVFDLIKQVDSLEGAVDATTGLASPATPQQKQQYIDNYMQMIEEYAPRITAAMDAATMGGASGDPGGDTAEPEQPAMQFNGHGRFTLEQDESGEFVIGDSEGKFSGLPIVSNDQQRDQLAVGDLYWDGFDNVIREKLTDG